MRHTQVMQIVVGAALAGLVATTSITAPARAQQGRQEFPETGYALEGRFLSYWQRHGGLPTFGYPISAVASEANSSGDTVPTQWLERERFELHSKNAAPYDVLLGRLGVDRLAQQNRDWRAFPKADPTTPHYFAETQQAIAAEFWDYWRTNGLDLGDSGVSARESLALFGYPISPAAIETNGDGDRVLTQWFERARFELHPGLSVNNKVLLGRLGAEIRASGAAPGQGKIAYVASSAQGSGALVRIANPDGSAALTLTATTGTSSLPRWSADGQLVTYSDGSAQAIVARRDGTIVLRYRGASDPALSPDGQTLVWSDTNGNLASGLVAGSGIAELTTSGTDTQPIWSPDGSKIAFESRRDGEAEVYVMNADGSNEINVSRNAATTRTEDHAPQWSPDSSRLVYAAERVAGTARGVATALVIVNADGSGSQRVDLSRFGISALGTLDWSPDGSAIAFAAQQDGNYEIYIVDAGINEIRNVSNHPGADVYPSWSPDSRRIAFEATREGVRAVHVIDADGSRVQRISEPNSGAPVWSPRSSGSRSGQRIAAANGVGGRRSRSGSHLAPPIASR